MRHPNSVRHFTLVRALFLLLRLLILLYDYATIHPPLTSRSLIRLVLDIFHLSNPHSAYFSLSPTRSRHEDNFVVLIFLRHSYETLGHWNRSDL